MLAFRRRKSILIRITAIATFVITLTGDAPGLEKAPAHELEPRHYIAHRLDTDGVVFVLDPIEVRRSKLREDLASKSTAALPAPKASFSGISPLWPTDAATLSKYAKGIETDLWTRIHAGDMWRLRAGPGGNFHLRIESLAVAQVHCSMHVAVIGRIVDEEAGAFAAAKSKYYLVVAESEAGSPDPRPANQRPDLLDWTNSLESPFPADLEAAIREEFEKRFVEYQKDGGIFDRQISRGVTEAIERQAILQRHSPGGGDLVGDLQTVRLGPAGEKRYYVRARLTLEGRSVFHISCWVTPDSHRIERVDFRSPMRIWGSWYSGFENLPMIQIEKAKITEFGEKRPAAREVMRTAGMPDGRHAGNTGAERSPYLLPIFKGIRESSRFPFPSSHLNT